MLWTLKKCWYRTYQKVLKFAMCFMDWKEPELLEGEGAVLRLPSFIKNKGINKVLMIKEIDKEHHEGIMIEKSENPHTECLEDYN